MFKYFSLLHGKFDLPVYPIAILSYDRSLSPASNVYEISLFNRPILRFEFQPIQLNRLNWREFLDTPNPVATALMSKMNIAREDRVRVKLECLRMLATLRLSPARTELIGGFMNSYLKLSEDELVVYNQGVQAFKPEERVIVMEVINEWKKMERVEMVLMQIQHRFGELPPELVQSVHNLPGTQVRELAKALFDFKSLSDAQEWITRAHLS